MQLLEAIKVRIQLLYGRNSVVFIDYQCRWDFPITHLTPRSPRLETLLFPNAELVLNDEELRSPRRFRRGTSLFRERLIDESG